MKINSKAEEAWIVRLLRGSGIIHALDSFAAFLYRKAGTSVIGHFLTSYDSEDAAYRRSVLGGGEEPSPAGTLRPVGHVLSRRIEGSAFIGAVARLANSLVTTQMKVYGWFLLSFGFYTLAVYALQVFGLGMEEIDPLHAYTGGAMMVISMPFLASRNTLIGALRGNRLMRAVLIHVVGFRPALIDNLTDSHGRSNLAFIIGMLLGVLTYLLPPLYLLVGLAALAVLYLILVMPEFGVLLCFAALPFAPTMAMAALVAFVTVSYILKLIRGKRVFRVHLLDVFLLLFMLLLLLGGVISVAPSESLKPALLFVCLMLGYFVTVNLINTPAWLRRVTVAMVSSAALVGLYGLYQNFFGHVEQTWQDSDMFSEIAGRVVSTFDNPNVLAEYLIMVIPFAAALLFSSKKNTSRAAELVTAAVLCACLVFTWSRGAWVGFFIGMFLFLLFMSRKTLVLCFFGICSLPFMPLILPDAIMSRITSIGNMADGSTSYRVYIWDAVVKMIGDCFPSGIGVGEGAFAQVYPMYAFAGIEAAPHSHNLFFQITVELGIVGLFVFVLAMVMLVQGSISYASDTFERRDKLLTYAGMCGILSILAQGMTDYVWYNYRVFLMFWLVVGLTVAYRRVGIASGRCAGSLHNDAGMAQIDLNL